MGGQHAPKGGQNLGWPGYVDPQAAIACPQHAIETKLGRHATHEGPKPDAPHIAVNLPPLCEAEVDIAGR